MGRVRRDIEVPIPPGARIYSNGQVYDPPAPPNREILIGYAVSQEMMHPNSSYFKFHSREWNRLHSEAPHAAQPYSLKAGLYAAVLGAAQKTGLYEDMVKVRGTRDANMIMDYAMFLISERENADCLMCGAPAGEVTFTGHPFSDSAWSEILSDPKNGNCSREILDLRLKRCIEAGLESVCLVLDRPDAGCDAEESAPAQPGDDESRRGGSGAGFIWAVQGNGADAGRPAACFLPEGGMTDAAFVHQTVEYFRARSISVAGVLCGSSFCSLDTFRLLTDAGLPYAAELRKNTYGFEEMVSLYGGSIRDPDNNTGNGIYGTAGESRLFKDSPFTSNISLFYDPERAGNQERKLLIDIYDAEKSIEDNISRGVRASVPRGLKKYLDIEGEGKNRTVVLDRKAASTDISRAGFFAIATYREMTPEQTMAACRPGMAAEESLRHIKGDLGGDAAGVFTAGARMKFFAGFVASALRYEIQQACLPLNLKTDRPAVEAGDVQYTLINGKYRYDENIRSSQRDLLAALGITADMLRDFAPELTRRYILQDADRPAEDQYNALPWPNTPTRSSAPESRSVSAGGSSPAAREKSAPETQGNRPRHPGGRPKGSRNRSTLAREAKEAEERARREAAGCPEPVKSKGGRPKGSRDSYQRTRSTRKQMEERRRAAAGDPALKSGA